MNNEEFKALLKQEEDEGKKQKEQYDNLKNVLEKTLEIQEKKDSYYFAQDISNCYFYLSLVIKHINDYQISKLIANEHSLLLKAIKCLEDMNFICSSYVRNFIKDDNEDDDIPF